MATNEIKVTAGEVVSSTRKYSNTEDGKRVFDIKADVNISNGKVTNFSNGSLVKRDKPDHEGNANFSSGIDYNYFSFNSGNLSAEETKEAVLAVLQFMSDVEQVAE